uniref:BHLH domain-containing protein n=1 Tax=Ornithodoros turicata TaxID=34597 RepID=A0A2R5LKN1_9ACAR
MACYFEMLRRVLPPCDRTNKRKRARAKVLKAAMEHLKFMESTILFLDGTLQDLNNIKRTFRCIVENQDINMTAPTEQNEVSVLTDTPSSSDRGGNKPYTNHRRKHMFAQHNDASNETTQGRSPLGDVTSKVASIANTALKPHGHRSYNDGTTMKVVAMRQPVLIEENCILGGFLALEEVQVVPSEDISIEQLETFDYTDDEQIVPEVGGVQTSYLQWTTQEPLNLKVAKSATAGDPLLGSAQQPGNSSPDLPLSAFSDLCWSSAGWASDGEAAASSQELLEQC